MLEMLRFCWGKTKYPQLVQTNQVWAFSQSILKCDWDLRLCKIYRLLNFYCFYKISSEKICCKGYSSNDDNETLYLGCNLKKKSKVRYVLGK